MYLETKKVQLKELPLSLSNLSESLSDFHVLHITDLHGAMFGENQNKIIGLLQDKPIDLIVITGDLFDSTWRDIKPGVVLIQELKRYFSCPILFVRGNHEVKGGAYPDLQKQLRRHGVEILDNRWIKLKGKKKDFYVAGIDDLIEGNAHLKRAISGIPAGKPIILLSHNPLIINEAKKLGIPLVLSGHTHGGQIKLPFIGAITASSPQGLFPHYVSGLYQEDQTLLYINSGLGTREIPLRLSNIPQLTLITINPDASN